MNRFSPGRFLTALAIILCFSSPSAGMRLEEKVGEHTFSNGLQLLTLERHDVPVLSAYITFGVGSVNEPDHSRGVAHLLEHMLFKGTKTLGTRDYQKEKPLLEKIEAVGSRLDELKVRSDPDPRELARLREELAELQKKHKELVVKDEFSRIYAGNGGVGYNAFTSKDMTTYVISLPSNKLELWAAIESDRMQNAVLREFYTEREVVREERRRSYETNPGGMLYENLIATAFTVHPYRNPVIGWDSDIVNLTLKETRDFLHRYYAPANTVIALVGDIDTEAAVAMVEHYFGNIPPGTPVPPVVTEEPPQRGEKRERISFEAEPQLAIAYHKPTLPERDDYVFDVIDNLLSAGRTSRLYRSLVIEQQLAVSVTTYGAPGSRYPNLFVVAATPRYPHTVEEVEQAIEVELRKLAREPASAAELEKARNRLATDQLRQLKSNSGLARTLTYYQTVAGDWRYLVDYNERIATVSAEEVMDVASRYFVPDNRTVVTIGREGGE